MKFRSLWQEKLDNGENWEIKKIKLPNYVTQRNPIKILTAFDSITGSSSFAKELLTQTLDGILTTRPDSLYFAGEIANEQCEILTTAKLENSNICDRATSLQTQINQIIDQEEKKEKEVE